MHGRSKHDVFSSVFSISACWAFMTKGANRVCLEMALLYLHCCVSLSRRFWPQSSSLYCILSHEASPAWTLVALDVDGWQHQINFKNTYTAWDDSRLRRLFVLNWSFYSSTSNTNTTRFRSGVWCTKGQDELCSHKLINETKIHIIVSIFCCCKYSSKRYFITIF